MTTPTAASVTLSWLGEENDALTALVQAYGDARVEEAERERDDARNGVARYQKLFAENGQRYWEARWRDEEALRLAAESQLAAMRRVVDAAEKLRGHSSVAEQIDERRGDYQALWDALASLKEPSP